MKKKNNNMREKTKKWELKGCDLWPSHYPSSPISSYTFTPKGSFGQGDKDAQIAMNYVASQILPR
jgi:hypothetical protein